MALDVDDDCCGITCCSQHLPTSGSTWRSPLGHRPQSHSPSHNGFVPSLERLLQIHVLIQIWFLIILSRFRPGILLFFGPKTHQTKKKHVYTRVALRNKHVSMRPASPKPFPTTKKDSGQEVPRNWLCLVPFWALPGAATVELSMVSSQCAFGNGGPTRFSVRFLTAFTTRCVNWIYPGTIFRRKWNNVRAITTIQNKHAHTHTPITPPITPTRHASLMTSNCGWKMFSQPD